MVEECGIHLFKFFIETLQLLYSSLLYSGVIHEISTRTKLWTHDIPTGKNLGPTKYPREKFGPTKYSQEKNPNPWGTQKKNFRIYEYYGTMTRDTKDPQCYKTHEIQYNHWFKAQFITISSLLSVPISHIQDKVLWKSKSQHFLLQS